MARRTGHRGDDGTDRYGVASVCLVGDEGFEPPTPSV